MSVSPISNSSSIQASQAVTHHRTRHTGTGRLDAAALGLDQDDTSGVLGTTLTDDQQQSLDALSSVLGTDSGSLMDSLKSGSSLSDLLSAKGVDADTIAAVLKDGLMFDATA